MSNTGSSPAALRAPLTAADLSEADDESSVLPVTTPVLESSSKISHNVSMRRLSANTGKTKRRCPYCPFTSYYSASLTVHLRRHTGEKPYQCPYCNKVKLFRDRSNMNSHIRRFHKEARARKIAAAMSSRSCPPPPPTTPATTEENLKSNFPTLDEMPLIAQIYSHANSSHPAGPEENPDSKHQPVVENQSFPIISKTNRRKPAVVRKQIRTERITEKNFLSPPDDALFGRINFSGNPSDEENLHAFHHEGFNDDQNIFSSAVQRQQSVELPSQPSTSSSGVETSGRRSSNSTDMSGVGLNPSDLYACQHCGIYFKSCILHTLHMGCHGYDDPFKCNTCGARCNDVVEFHCHFARASHRGAL